MTEFEKLFADNRELIYKYLLRLSQNPSLAEELTQETFFRAFMNYTRLRKRQSAPAWLCQIAKNTYFAWYNAHKKRSVLEEDALPDTYTPEELLVQKELSRQAADCLQALAEPYKTVFMLAVFDGLSLKDISAVFGKSESWARVTFYRAKQKLLEGMKKYEL